LSTTDRSASRARIYIVALIRTLSVARSAITNAPNLC